MSISQHIPTELVNELEAASKRARVDRAGPSAPLRSLPAGVESPFGELRGERAAAAYSGDQWGASSLQKFADVSGLSHTHEDAWGFLEYLNQFAPYNYWFGDGNVQVWQYEEAYDNWQDTYGVDAVLAFYHSGHGGMDGNGVFQVPLGAAWDNRTWAFSNNMRLGNEQVRYIFWSTCLSLRVLEGHNPIRTWSPANLGFRMLFGYETTSIDHGGYGRAFWNQWKSGKSLSQAFLDASWYNISTHQAPSVLACGTDATDASNRLYNERSLSWDAVSHNWWQWRWYYAAASAAGLRAPNLQTPATPLVGRLRRERVDELYFSQIRDRHDLPLSVSPKELSLGSGRGFLAAENGIRLAVAGDGSYEATLAAPNRENKAQIPIRSAIRIAQDLTNQHGIDGEGLIFDRVMHQYEAGGTVQGDGELREPAVTETVVQFTQTVNGLPVLAPGRGQVSVSIDNDGLVTSVRNTVAPVVELSDRSRRIPTPPGETAPTHDREDIDGLLDDQWQARLRTFVMEGKMPRSFSEVPGSSEVGYALRGDEAVLVARREMEADHGHGIAKRHLIEVPLAE